MLSTIRDITDRKRAEAALAGQEAWFRTTLNSIADAVIASDARGRVIYLNAAAESLTGWSVAAAVGQPLDPHKHQAMVEIPSDQEPGTIVEEMQAGYMLKDRLLRPALVGVARAG